MRKILPLFFAAIIWTHGVYPASADDHCLEWRSSEGRKVGCALYRWEMEELDSVSPGTVRNGNSRVAEEPARSILTLAWDLSNLSDRLERVRHRLWEFRTDLKMLAKTGKVGKKDVDGWIARDVEKIGRHARVWGIQVRRNETFIRDPEAHFGIHDALEYGFRVYGTMPSPWTFGRAVLFRHLMEIEKELKDMSGTLGKFFIEFAPRKSGATDDEIRILRGNIEFLAEYSRIFTEDLEYLTDALETMRSEVPVRR